MWSEYINEAQYQSLKKRVGSYHLSKRLLREAEHSILQMGGYGFQINWEHMPWLFHSLKIILKTLGLYEQGKSNAINYEVIENSVVCENLPNEFSGYRILHLSDLHIDAIPDGGEKLREQIRELDYDLCVITGDYRFDTSGPIDELLFRMIPLLQEINAKDGVYGILGNHDFIEMVPALEEIGLPILLNESIRIKRDEESIILCGVDDEHFYKVADLVKSLGNSSTNDFKVLLAHSQEVIGKASDLGFGLYLCGHTHGGQICLPGGIPVITNTGFHKKCIKGAWNWNQMPGYTSKGTGASGLPVRFFCKPEITVHTLS